LSIKPIKKSYAVVTVDGTHLNNMDFLEIQ